MKVSEAIKILAMFDANTEVELIFPDAQEVMVTVRPKVPAEGEMAMMPMYPSEQEWFEQHNTALKG
jgi:hypothetical protein